jgi:ACS family hexuronate transporter-like MFS transporter
MTDRVSTAPGSSPIEQQLPPSTAAPLTGAGGSLRWTICAMLFFATSINYMDRQVLGILAPTLQHSIGWTEAQYGYIVGAFQVAYAIGLVAAGRMVDRLGSRIGYAIIMGIWSLAAMAHALATSALTFGIARFFLGLGEAGNFPAAIKTTAEWFPRRERALATGIFNSGTNLGAILAPAIVPWVTLRFGWQAAFLLTGAFSLTWIVWWLAHYRQPNYHPKLKPAELNHILSDPVDSTVPIPWKSVLGYRQTWALVAAKFLTDPVWWFYLYWLPKFFDTRFHLGLSHLGLPLIIVYNVSVIGSVGGGWLPSFFNRKGMPISRARLRAMLIAACIVLPIAFASHLSSEWMAVAFLSVAAAAHQAWSANLLTTASDMFPRSAVGVVTGIGGMGGALGGVLFSLSTGWVLQLTHSYDTLFYFSGTAYLLALFLLGTLSMRLRPVELAQG